MPPVIWTVETKKAPWRNGASFGAYSESEPILFYFEFFFKFFFAIALICAENFFGFLARVLRARAVILSVTACPVLSSITVFFTRFGMKRLFVFLLE